MPIQVLLKRTPGGTPGAADFTLRTTDVTAPAAGELACETLFLSLDPRMRGRISGRHLAGPIAPDELMAGETVCRVLDSRSDAFDAGDIVTAHAGWHTHPVIPAANARPVDPRLRPASLALGIAGMPGLTAWAGVTRLIATFVVSSAAGPVGSLVGQLARLRGARVTGIAGSAGKCAWLVREAGFADAIDDRAEPLGAGLDRCCPDGVDRYFDNVGADVPQAVMERLAIGAEVVLCGLMAQYNSTRPPPGPNPALVIRARATVRGLVVYVHEDLRWAMVNAVTDGITRGAIAWREGVSEGIESATGAFARRMRGETFGKVIVRVAA